MGTKTDDLQHQLQVAQVSFVTAASRLLDDAEEVREQRDELMRLLKLANESGRRQETPANA